MLYSFLRNMKKAFYASAFIFETLKVFGEVSDEVRVDNGDLIKYIIPRFITS